jgi:GAF domain-containing protein
MADPPAPGPGAPPRPVPTVRLPRRSPPPGDPAALAALVDRLPAAVLALDAQGRLSWLNAAAERLLGHPQAELLGVVLVDVPGTAGRALAAAGAEAADSAEPVTVQAGGGWYEVRAARAAEGLALTVSDVSGRRTVQERADRAAARATLLVRVAAELSGALDGVSALGRLARLVVPVLTDGCVVTVVDREGRARDVGSWHADPDRRDVLARYARVRLETMPPASPVARALSAGTPVSAPVSDVLALMSDDRTRGMLAELRAESVLVLPLPAESRTVGVLSLYLDPGRDVTAEDLATARAVAVQAGRAIDRVGRQSRQIQLAEALQRSLLTAPPAFPGVEVVVRYVPAAEAARVGGDWYDAFRHPDGDAVVVIGDVVGHDTAAAAAMGQLRGLLRGIAHSGGAGPADVLQGPRPGDGRDAPRDPGHRRRGAAGGGCHPAAVGQRRPPLAGAAVPRRHGDGPRGPRGGPDARRRRDRTAAGAQHRAAAGVDGAAAHRRAGRAAGEHARRGHRPPAPAAGPTRGSPAAGAVRRAAGAPPRGHAAGRRRTGRRHRRRRTGLAHGGLGTP